MQVTTRIRLASIFGSTAYSGKWGSDGTCTGLLVLYQCTRFYHAFTVDISVKRLIYERVRKLNSQVAKFFIPLTQNNIIAKFLCFVWISILAHQCLLNYSLKICDYFICTKTFIVDAKSLDMYFADKCFLELSEEFRKDSKTSSSQPW